VTAMTRTLNRLATAAGLMVVLPTLGYAQGGNSVSDGLAVARALQDAFRRVIESVQPAVVGIQRISRVAAPAEPPGDEPTVGTPQPGDGSRLALSMGAGFIADPSGWILTCAPVVENGQKIEVVLGDGTSLVVKEIYYDRVSGVAALKVEPGGTKLAALSLYDSGPAELGQWAIAVGPVWAEGECAGVGTVTCPSVRLLQAGRGTLRTTTTVMVASIDPDAAGIGAPVVDLDGRVIGILHKVEQDPEHRAEPGGATAIPSAQLKAVFEHIRAGGAVKRAWFGIGLQSIAPEILADLGAAKGGIYVSAVKPGGPADKGGMKVGDIMVALTVLDGKQAKPVDLRKHADLTAATEWAAPGTHVRVDIVRDGQPGMVEVVLGTFPEVPLAGGEAGSEGPDLGVTVVDPGKEAIDAMGVRGGALVSDVDPSGLGHLLGIRKGDLIVRVGTKVCRSASDFEEAIAALRGKPRVTIELRRAEPDVVASYVVSGSL